MLQLVPSRLVYLLDHPQKPLFPSPFTYPSRTYYPILLSVTGLSSPVKPPSHLLPPSKTSRTTATVPPLHQTPSSAHQVSSAAATTQSSSFAAALKSLARNAGGTGEWEGERRDRRHQKRGCKSFFSFILLIAGGWEQI